ncbi:MAG TPA: DUF5678 domain-containing protein [Candidatus Nanoarchaeia archaeon]|nr:DUF5678 domain-containing protein [Candidatus Nanoarchaeia archaeon]
MPELIQMDTKKYRGEWIVIIDDVVIAHNKDIRLLKDVIDHCKKKPLIMKVPDADILLY